MKRFDVEANKQRNVQRFSIHNKWAQIAEDGTIDSLLDVFSEAEAELARYLEHLYQEKKYRNARDISSITHMTDLIGYKRCLPRSAIGFVIVSHTDLDGVDRLSNFGTSFFNLDDESDYDELIKKENASTTEKSALVPWFANKSYCIPEGTIFKTADGIPFIATETVYSRQLKEPFSVIKRDKQKYEDFVAAGGWNGIKYIKVPIIQGEIQSLEFGKAEGKRFESFQIDSTSIEAGINIISEKFLKVKVTPHAKVNGKDVELETETWEKIEDIGLAGPYDKVFELKIIDKSDRVLIKFGDGITGSLLPRDAIISIEYLSTLGESGNVYDKYQITQLALPNGQSMVDPRNNSISKYLTCTNICAILGGNNIESTEEIKEAAPPSYQKNYTIGTRKNYLTRILKKSPVNLLHCLLLSSDVVESESYGEDSSLSNDYISNIDDTTNVLQEVTSKKSSLIITAIKSNGDLLEDPENELLEPLRKELYEYTSTNESLEFIQPNLIELRPNVTIKTPQSILESQIKEDLSLKLSKKFSIFNRDFNEELFSSDVIDEAYNLPYTENVESFLEAKTVCNLEPSILTTTQQSGLGWIDQIGFGETMETFNKDKFDNETLLAFDFGFDKIFVQDDIKKGFSNYRDRNKFLIQANIKFTDDSTKNRTLFLIDNRYNIQENLSISEAYKRPVKENMSYPKSADIYYGQTILNWPNNEEESFDNFQARTAQYNLIENALSSEYKEQLLSFLNSPFEIRPLFIDETGKNKIFNEEDVPSSDKVSLNFDNIYNTSKVYRKNWQYIDHCKIEFSESYDDPNSETYARGRIILPLKYIFTKQDILTLKVLLENINDFDDQTLILKKYLNGKFKIEVFARPIQDKFYCNNEFDLIYMKKDDYIIEKR